MVEVGRDKGRAGKGWEVGKKTDPWFTTGEGNINLSGVQTGASTLPVTPGDWPRRGPQL